MTNRWRLWVVGLGVIAVLLVALPADARAPEWMRPAVEDGRESLRNNMDTVRAGPLVFAGARCRSDGAFLLFFTYRWLLVVPDLLFVDVQAGWENDPRPGSYGGGYANALAIEYGHDLSGYFGQHREIACPPSG
jgi:hypothetical protein